MTGLRRRPGEITEDALRIGEFARLVGGSPRWIRSLEARGLIRIPRDPAGHRRLGPAEAEEMKRAILHMDSTKTNARPVPRRSSLVP